MRLFAIGVILGLALPYAWRVHLTKLRNVNGSVRTMWRKVSSNRSVVFR